MVRLSDEPETRSVNALRQTRPGLKGRVEPIALSALGRLGYSLNHRALLILGIDGSADSARVE